MTDWGLSHFSLEIRDFSLKMQDIWVEAKAVLSVFAEDAIEES